MKRILHIFVGQKVKNTGNHSNNQQQKIVFHNYTAKRSMSSLEVACKIR